MEEAKPAEELTLDQYVDGLPAGHTARKELEELREEASWPSGMLILATVIALLAVGIGAGQWIARNDLGQARDVKCRDGVVQVLIDQPNDSRHWYRTKCECGPTRAKEGGG